jgi:ribose transport system permease protein
MGQGDPIVGEGFLFDSIIPVLLGGTSFSGGKGGIVGTLAGVFVLTTLKNIMNLVSVSAYWQWIAEGLVVLLAASLYMKEKAYT